MARAHVHQTLIVGAGFSGIGAAIKLAEAGLGDDKYLRQTRSFRLSDYHRVA